MRGLLDESGSRLKKESRECENCGQYVTKQFVRVFGGNDGKVYGCPNCLTGRELRAGKSTRPDE